MKDLEKDKALEKNSTVTNLINKIEAKTKIGDQGAERKVKDLEKNSTVTTDLLTSTISVSGTSGPMSSRSARSARRPRTS